MKISRTQHIKPVEAIKPRQERVSADVPTPIDTVARSSSTAFVENAREAAVAGPAFRPDVVADVKEAIAAGTFESSLDMDAAMDSLLADL